MKTILLAFFLFLSLSLFSQASGGLRVKSFTNETNDLSDNHEEDSTYVRIINKHNSVDTTICFSNENKFRVSLKSGNYRLICSIRDRTIELNNVSISPDMITFVDLLFEPEKKLNLKERRKRKKMFYNYRN